MITGLTALIAGLAGVALTVWQLLNLPFQPGQSGFASVFVGFYPVALAVWFGAMVWLEILLARARNIPAISFVEQPPTYAAGVRGAAVPVVAECVHHRVELPRDRRVHILAAVLRALTRRLGGIDYSVRTYRSRMDPRSISAARS